VALQIVGDLEVVYRLAAYDTLKKVRFQQRSEPCLLIRGGVDPFLKAETRVPFDIHFVSTKSHHAILTGPNRGGKSSVLRSTLLSVLFAQTFGLGFLDETSMFHLRPFDWISTGLRLEDRPGKISMFESEVEFATQILNIASSNKDKVGLVLFDELFHSTNPPDGAHTASIFLRRLWTQKNVASFISTHVFDLALSSPPHVQRLCVPAVKDKMGNLTFTYTLKPGVCQVSSVELILKEKGLI
jgi:DNA mismatch repair protein MSH6